jgi:hypothetical protein
MGRKITVAIKLYLQGIELAPAASRRRHLAAQAPSAPTGTTAMPSARR